MMRKKRRIRRSTETVTQPQPQPIPFFAPSVNPLSPSPLREKTRPINPPTKAHVRINFNIVNKFNIFPAISIIRPNCYLCKNSKNSK